MTQNGVAMALGEAVFTEAHKDSGNRSKAADKVMADLFPALGTRNRVFLRWALLRAESMYVQRKRPILPDAGHSSSDAHRGCAPSGTDNNAGGHPSGGAHLHPAPGDTPIPDAGHYDCGAREPRAPSGDIDDAEEGGQGSVDAQNSHAPTSRRRLHLMHSDPADYIISVGGNRKRLGDMTREDWGYLHGDHRNRRRNQEAREKGYGRIYNKMPSGARFEDVMDDVLDDRDRAFLAGELGKPEMWEAA